MTSAHVSGLVAERNRMGDHEGAYLAGMLQNLGEVLVAHRTPSEHAAIQRRIDAGSSRDAACVKEMGFTFDQLARVIGRHWKLAPSVSALWESDQAAMTNLSLLARFANELTRVMCLSTTAHRQAAIALLLMRHGSAFSLTGDDVVEVWENALADVRNTFNSLGVPIGSLKLRTRIDSSTVGHLHIDLRRRRRASASVSRLFRSRAEIKRPYGHDLLHRGPANLDLQPRPGAASPPPHASTQRELEAFEAGKP